MVKGSSKWTSVWETAGDCFEATMHALSASELPIESLEVFSGVTCCSLSLDRLAAIQELNLSTSLQRLKRLSMSLSHHMVYKLGRKLDEESEEMQALTTGERHTMAICKFLNIVVLYSKIFTSTGTGFAKRTYPMRCSRNSIFSTALYNHADFHF
jgi:hypothetical protein